MTTFIELTQAYNNEKFLCNINVISNVTNIDKNKAIVGSTEISMLGEGYQYVLESYEEVKTMIQNATNE